MMVLFFLFLFGFNIWVVNIWGSRYLANTEMPPARRAKLERWQWRIYVTLYAVSFLGVIFSMLHYGVGKK